VDTYRRALLAFGGFGVVAAALFAAAVVGVDQATLRTASVAAMVLAGVALAPVGYWLLRR
jgi:hypothetical protein